MPRDKTLSHQRIVKAAKEEFLEKGYINASMRSIGERAGITCAGLYRHYKNKEDMFNSLVEPVIQKIEGWYKEHARNHYKLFEKNANKEELFSSNETDIARIILYNYRDEMRLIINCSQGTKYEDFLDSLANLRQKELLKAMEYMRNKGVKIKEISEENLHILLSAYTTAFLEPIIHDWPIEKAEEGINTVEEFFMPGWIKIMGY